MTVRKGEPWGQPAVCPDDVRIRFDKLVQTQRREADGGADYDPHRVRHNVGEFFARPETHHPPAANWTGQPIAHPML